MTISTHSVFEDGVESVVDFLSLLGSDEKVNMINVRNTPEKFLQNHLSQKPCPSGDEDTGTSEEFLDIRTLKETMGRVRFCKVVD